MELWQHQKDGVEFSKKHEGFLFHWGMGSGKTIGTLGVLQSINAKVILVVTPKSVMRVWGKELEKFAQTDFDIQVFDKGTVRKKTENIELFLAQTKHRRKIVVLNYESIWREGLGEVRMKNRIMKKGLLRDISWDAIVLDEAHRICRASSAVSKFCGRLSGSTTKRIALTGTPLPNGCLSAYGLFRFLKPEIFGSSDFRFKLRYAQFGGFEGHQILGYINQDEFKEKFSSITHQVKVRDVVELPDTTHIEIECTLSPIARKMYDEFKNECILEIGDSFLTAENVLVKTLRLAQIASGVIVDETGQEHIIDTSKIEAVVETIESIDEPIVIFGRFRSEINGIAEYLDKEKISYSKLIGGCNELKQWQNGETRVLLVNLQSGALGIDCTRARYNLYMSTGYNYANYEQSMARTCRPGADLEKKIFYYHYNAINTVDKAVSKAMINKESVIEAILGDLEKFTIAA